jgi:heme a synthase
VVRATGSGDGCGTSWPTCDGAVVPLDPGLATALEFGHRLLSVAVGLVGLALLVTAARTRRAHPGLLPTVLVAAFFFVAQALVGAWTVTAGLTGDSTDPLRAIVLPIHLVNSFTQLAALAVAVRYAGPSPPGRWRAADRRPVVAVLAVSALAFYALVFTGGIAALGDLFAPVDSLAEGVALDFSPDAPWVVRVRVLHPALAAALGVLLLASAAAVPALQRSQAVARAGRRLAAVYVVQLLVGTWNLVALAPLPLSVSHQALAMVAFVLFVMLLTTALTDEEAGAPAPSPPVATR